MAVEHSPLITEQPLWGRQDSPVVRQGEQPLGEFVTITRAEIVQEVRLFDLSSFYVKGKHSVQGIRYFGDGIIKPAGGPVLTNFLRVAGAPSGEAPGGLTHSLASLHQSVSRRLPPSGGRVRLTSLANALVA